MGNRVIALVRIDVLPLGLEPYGYFIPTFRNWVVEKIRVCDDDCRLVGVRTIMADPLELDWTGGELGDFNTGIGPILAAREICTDICGRFDGIEQHRIHVNKPKGKKGQRLAEHYQELRPVIELEGYPEGSTVTATDHCVKCGRTSYRLEGTEQPPGEMQIGDRWEPAPGVPRSPGHGILVPRSLIESADFIKIHGFTLCTERVKSYILERGWTNVSFLEYGEIVEGR